MSLRVYGALLAERWWTVALGALIGLAFGAAFIATSPTTYTASTDVRVDVVNGDPTSGSDSDSERIDSATEMAVAESSTVAAAAAQALGDVSAAEVQGNVVAAMPSNSAVLTVSYTAATTSDARAGADAVAVAYLAQRTASAETRIAEALALVEGERTSVLAQIEALPVDSSSVERDGLVLTLTELSSLRVSLLGRLEDAGFVLTPAAANPVVTAPNTRLILMSGLLGGALVGTCWAFARELASRRVASARHAGRLIGRDDLTDDGDERRGVRASDYRAVVQLALPEGAVGSTTIAVIELTDVPTLTAAAFNLVAAAEEVATVELLAGSDRELDPAHMAALLPGDELRASISTEAHVNVLGVPGQTSRARWLRVLKECDGVLIVVQPGRTVRRSLIGLSEDARDLGVPILGLIGLDPPGVMLEWPLRTATPPVSP